METTTRIEIRGMTCGGCVASVKRVLEALPGVTAADVSLETASAAVRHDETVADRARLRAAVEDAGFEVV